MLEFLTGTGLAVAAGLNAYIPLLAIGLASRFLDFFELPANWMWLENDWVMVILGVLLVIELVADKIPVVDSINDWIQTIVRPASGGIVFGSGAASETAAVTDPAAFFSSNQWVPIAIGVVIALGVHGTKMAARPVLNAVTFGAAAPLVSAAEDVSSVAMTIFAIVFPMLVIFALAALIWGFIAVFRRAKRKKKAQAELPSTSS